MLWFDECGNFRRQGGINRRIAFTVLNMRTQCSYSNKKNVGHGQFSNTMHPPDNGAILYRIDRGCARSSHRTPAKTVKK